MIKLDQYATVKNSGSKKISVCARRIGSRDRLSVIATCDNEDTADKIVLALNALQGMVDKVEAPALRVLEDVRTMLAKERATAHELHRDKKELENKLRDKERELAQAKRERDVAQKTARETA
jgi:hypothetical protein